MLLISPGMPRHITSLLSACGHDQLSEGQSAVVRRIEARDVDFEASPAQALAHRLEQALVLEAATREHHLRNAPALGHRLGEVDECFVEPPRHHGGSDAPNTILEQRAD